MNESRKRPSFLRFIVSLFIGLLLSGGILYSLQPYYERYLQKSILREPFFIIAAISALVIALMLFIPTKKPLRLLKWIPRLVIMAILVALVFGVGIFFQAQSDMLFMPGRRDLAAEATLKANPQAEEITIGEGNEALHGYLLKTTPGKSGLILYFGGNGELSAARVSELAQHAASGFFNGYNFMMLDYPGYGQSAGEPNEKSVMAMARAAMRYALTREDVDPNRVVLAGWSLGSGPAAMLASENQAAGLILMAPFYNGTDLVNGFLRVEYGLGGGLLGRIPGFMVSNKFQSDSFARLTNVQALVLGAKEDEVIPVEQAERLARQYRDARFIMLSGGHAAPWSEQAAFEAISAYLIGLGGQQVPTIIPEVTAAP